MEYRVGHYIFALWFLLLSSSFFSSPNLSRHRCLPYFHTWCCLSANLRCRSEACCMGLTHCKYRTQNVVKKSSSGQHRTTLSGYIFTTNARIDNRRKAY